MYIRASVADILSESHDFQMLQAARFNTSPRVLSQLANSQYSDVRAIVAKNSHTPEEVLRKLVTDENIKVRNAARTNTKRPDDFANIDTDEWYYSTTFECKVTIYYPGEAVNMDYCDKFVEESIRNYVNDYGNFEYIDGRIYSESDRDYHTFIFKCQYNAPEDETDSINTSFRWASWLADDLNTFIVEDMIDADGGEYGVCSINFTQLLGD